MTLSALHKPKGQQDITDQKARHRRHSFPYHSNHALSSYEVKDESYNHLSDLPFRGRCRGSAHCRVTRHHLALQLETNKQERKDNRICRYRGGPRASGGGRNRINHFPGGWMACTSIIGVLYLPPSLTCTDTDRDALTQESRGEILEGFCSL